MFKRRLSQVLWAITKWYAVDTLEWGFPAKQEFILPLALWAANVLASTALTTATQTITTGITSPDILRCVSIVWGAALMAGNVTITWTNWADRIIVDVIALNATNTVKGVKAFKTITSIALPVLTTAWDAVSVWLTDKLGLYRDIETSTDVTSVMIDTSREVGQKQVDTVTVTGTIGSAAVKTLTASADFVATDSITVDVDWVTVTQAYDTDNDTTIAALAVKIAAKAGIATATVTNAGTSDHEIVITAAAAGTDFTIENATEDTTGTTTFVVATTTENGSTALITAAGWLSLTASFDTNLTTTNSNFVTANAAAYLAEGIVLTSSVADLIFTASAAGEEFVHPVITNVLGDLAGSTANTTANIELPTIDATNSTVETITALDGTQVITLNYLTKVF